MSNILKDHDATVSRMTTAIERCVRLLKMDEAILTGVDAKKAERLRRAVAELNRLALGVRDDG